MKRGELRIRTGAFLGALALFIAASGTQAQPAKARQEFVPQVGQPGKDVIWVPTPDAVVKRMLEMAKVGPKDYVVDLGSGDGRTVIAAARDFGATALGVEFNPKMVELSRQAAAQAGVSKRAQFRRGDIFATDFSRATVVTMYLLPDVNLRLRPRLLDMRPGTRIVSHSFKMDEWQPDLSDEVEGHGIYFWIVPAKVDGNWSLRQPGRSMDISLTQKFQKVRGTARSGQDSTELRDVTLSGDRISFSLDNSDGSRSHYTGSVLSASMQGNVSTEGQPPVQWTASRR